MWSLEYVLEAGGWSCGLSNIFLRQRVGCADWRLRVCYEEVFNMCFRQMVSCAKSSIYSPDRGVGCVEPPIFSSDRGLEQHVAPGQHTLLAGTARGTRTALRFCYKLFGLAMLMETCLGKKISVTSCTHM